MGQSLEEQRYARFEAAYNTAQYALCVALGRDFLEDYPEHGVAWALLGLALIKLARYEDARAALRESIKHVSQEHLSLPYAWMGDLYSRRGDYKRAAKWYRKAIEIEPDHARGHLYLGMALTRNGDLAEAEAAFRAAIETDRGDIAEAWLNLGLVLRSQERFDEATAALRRAVEIDEESLRAQMALEDVERVLRYQRSQRFQVISNPTLAAKPARSPRKKRAANQAGDGGAPPSEG